VCGWLLRCAGWSVGYSEHLGYDTVSLDEWFLTFWRTVVPLSSLIMQFERNYLILEDEGGACLQDGRNPLPNNTVSHRRQAESSAGLLWELQVLQRVSSYLMNVDSSFFVTAYCIIVKHMMFWVRLGRSNQWKIHHGGLFFSSVGSRGEEAFAAIFVFV